MGAFFLYHKETEISRSKVEELYKKKGFCETQSFQIGEYYLMLYKKQLVGNDNFYKDGSNYIFVCGSLFYKGLGYKKSLESLLSDFTNNCINSPELYGNYVILYYNGEQKELLFCIDPAFIKNVYFDINKKIISSDFLALIETSPETYTLNHMAIIENLTTGHLISPDTYANEIQKLDKKNINQIESGFPGIKVKNLRHAIDEQINGYEAAVEHANEQLSEYFESVKNLTNEFGANIGLTGGFDSRLLLMHARKHLKRLITNSFWRPNSREYTNAKELAKAADFDFVSFEEKHFEKPEKEEMLRKAYLFFDGQFRSQNNWDEEFNLPEYSAKIAANYLVGFHGCGGEQYRNADRLIGKISFRTYIQFEWMFKQCENAFLDRKLQAAVYKNIKRKIMRLIDISDNRIGLLELKRIQNEIWNTANRATRVNVLNQQQFYFAPFTEYQISHSAYSYVPFLKKSLSFQMEIMRRIDPELSAVKTNYGFNILEGEPFNSRLIPYIMKIIPRSIFYKLYFRVRRIQNKHLKLTDFHSNMNQYFHELGNKIDLIKLRNNINLGNGLTACNFLLNYLKISYLKEK